MARRPSRGEMASREEAKFHLTQCGARSLDRDGDGIPRASPCKPRAEAPHAPFNGNPPMRRIRLIYYIRNMKVS